MVPIDSPSLTKIGFRRDIKAFLAGLVGFLVFIILTLVLLLQGFVVETEEARWAQWRSASEAAVDSLRRLDPTISTQALEQHLDYLRRRHDISAIEVRREGRPVMISGYSGFYNETINRDSPFGTVILSFDASTLHVAQRRFVLVAAICVAATIGGTILFLFYLPKIVRPIEQMLDHARELGERAAGVDETHYLIETFRSSIDTLKKQEVELKRLHDLEKSRADELERITATLTRSLSSGFIALDAAGLIVDMNAAAREILQLEPQEASGLSVSAALGESPFARALQKAIEDRAALIREEIDATDSTTIGLSTVPLLSQHNEFLGMLALFTDLTPIRKLQARVREVQTLADLGEISAGIAHEFRNSLSTILGYLKLARRHPLSDESQAKIRSAEDEAALLSSAVEALLNFARPMTLEYQQVDLRELTASLVEKLDSGESDVQFQLEGSEVQIDGDRTLLSRAIENILRNAVDAVRQKGQPGRVLVNLTAEPHPTMSIRDSGVGLDPAQAARLFLPFQSDKPQGMGLGLPLARKIVLLHGGTIRLTGEQGIGAVVTIDFPSTHDSVRLPPTRVA